MAKVYLGLGTNLGNREDNLCIAIDTIEKRIGKLFSRSAFYVTAPWGYESDEAYLNAAVGVLTNLLPLELMLCTQVIEKEMGREHKTQLGEYKDRIIDIDILLYDDWVIEENDLIIPHPLMTERAFVMEPLAEIAPGYIHPTLGKSIAELASLIKV